MRNRFMRRRGEMVWISAVSEAPLCDLPAVDEEGMGLTDAFHLDGAAVFQLELILQQFSGGGGAMDATSDSAAFHAACEVDGVSPQVVGELADPDDTGDDGS